jgi:hypothetical protein
LLPSRQDTAKLHKLVWGAGPVFVLPTATSKVLGQGKVSMGPSVVALVQPGAWTLGALINNAWSVAGPSDRSSVNQMTLQYFVNYNLKKGWYLSSSPIITANWRAANGNVWTVPLGGGVGRVFRLGFQPVNVAAQFFGNAALRQEVLRGACGYKLRSCSRSCLGHEGEAKSVTGEVTLNAKRNAESDPSCAWGISP